MKLDDYAWWRKNAKDSTHPVGQKKPNAWGLYDMQGNVWEWCADGYAKDYYAKSPAKDPIGPDSGEVRLLRGGSWDNVSPDDFRCAFRVGNSPDRRRRYTGFRVARTLTP